MKRKKNISDKKFTEYALSLARLSPEQVHGMVDIFVSLYNITPSEEEFLRTLKTNIVLNLRGKK